MDLNNETIKPKECLRCHLEFPQNDNMRWSLYNINKHIKACEDKHLEKENIKKSQKSVASFFSKLDNSIIYDKKQKLIMNIYL